MGPPPGVIPVKVYVRCRPFNQRETNEHAQPCLTFYKEANQIVIATKPFTFDRVMDPSTSQKAVFENTTQSLIEKIMNGFNCTILAYGQTGSGKTHTMGTEETTESMSSDNRGIIPRLVEKLFSSIASSDCPNAYQVYVSMLEIYDEKVNDLLSSAKDLQVREQNGSVVVQGLARNPVKDLAATMSQLEIGGQLRSKGETAMNAQSSRSHAIFTVVVDKAAMSETDTAFQSKLHLVDLAGSERLKKTQAEGIRKNEGIKINEGLLALGNVISALSEAGGPKHIPYRDSKITRLLQDSLGGNSYTVMIACISPADTNSEETMSTLRYADRAKKIKNKPIVNQDVGQAALLKQLTDKIRQLEQQLADRGDFAPDYEPPTKKMATEALLIENKALQTKQAKLYLAKANLEGKLNKLAETMKEIKEKTEAHGDNPEETIKQIQMLVNTEEGETTDFSILGLIEIDPDDNAFDANTEYVARVSQLDQELTTNAIEIKSRDDIRERTKNDLESFKKYENEKTMLIEKVETLEAEREKLLRDLKKNTTTGKLAEERRQRMKELEQQMTNLKKQLNDHKKLEKQKLECEQRIKRMDGEILELKQNRVKLQKSVKEENEKFRALKVNTERQLNQLKAQERKKELAHIKETLAQQKQIEVLRQKLETSQKAVKRFTATKAKKRPLIGDGRDQANQIKKYLMHELELLSGYLGTTAESKQLANARAESVNNIKKSEKILEKLRKIENPSEKDINEIAGSEKIIEDAQQVLDNTNDQFQTLLAAQAEYDDVAAAEERCKTLQKVGRDSAAVIKIMFDMLSELFEEKIKLKNTISENSTSIQSVKSHVYRKEKAFQDKVEHFSSEVENYYQQFRTELTVLVRKIEDQATENERLDVVEGLQKLLAKLEEETESMQEELEKELPAKRRLKKPTFYGKVVDSERNIEGTPQAMRNMHYQIGKRRSKPASKVLLSPIFDPDARNKTTRVSDKNVLEISSSQENLNTTIVLSNDEDRGLNSTFVKGEAPKRHAGKDNRSEAPPLKVRSNHDVTLGAIP